MTINSPRTSQMCKADTSLNQPSRDNLVFFSRLQKTVVVNPPGSHARLVVDMPSCRANICHESEH